MGTAHLAQGAYAARLQYQLTTFQVLLNLLCPYLAPEIHGSVIHPMLQTGIHRGLVQGGTQTCGKSWEWTSTHPNSSSVLFRIIDRFPSLNLKGHFRLFKQLGPEGIQPIVES